MISLIVTLIFFGMLISLYPAAVLVLFIGAWVIKKYGRKAGNEVSEIRRCRQIDSKMDRLKEVVFNISVVLIFFVAAPFAVFCFL